MMTVHFLAVSAFLVIYSAIFAIVANFLGCGGLTKLRGGYSLAAAKIPLEGCQILITHRQTNQCDSSVRFDKVNFGDSDANFPIPLRVRPTRAYAKDSRAVGPFEAKDIGGVG